MMSDCNLLDIPTRGLSYIWTDRRTYVRLDRSLGNMEWLDAWESMECRTLPRAFSDHCPLLLTCSRLVYVPKTPFKFRSMWLTHDGFLDMVKVFWEGLNFAGCPMFVFTAKLRALKLMLKGWNKSVFGMIVVRVEQAKGELEAVQQLLSDHGPSDEILHDEKLAHL